MPITDEEAAGMRRPEVVVKNDILAFLQGKSEWYSAKEIAKGIGMKDTDTIYDPTLESDIVRTLAFISGNITTPRKPTFRGVLSRMVAEGTVRYVVDADNVFYYRLVEDDLPLAAV